MGLVKRRMRIRSASALYRILSAQEGTGTSANKLTKKVRRALEEMRGDPGGEPFFYQDEDGRKLFGVDGSDPKVNSEGEIEGFKTLKFQGKPVKCGLLELPKRIISTVIWKDALLTVLEKKHSVEQEDLIQGICEDFAADGLLEQFQNVTESGKDELEWSEDDLKDEEPKKEKKSAEPPKAPEPVGEQKVLDATAKKVEEEMLAAAEKKG